MSDRSFINTKSQTRVDLTKYLGISADKNLRWSIYISTFDKKLRTFCLHNKGPRNFRLNKTLSHFRLTVFPHFVIVR